MRVVSLLVLASLALTSVDAGCYPEGKRSAEKTKSLKDKGLYSASGAKPTHPYSLKELPKAWDWCNVNGQSFCTASWNQHIPMYCGACWVHGALGAVNDRVKIALNAKHDLMLARQVILNCAQSKGFGAGCNGGDGQDVFEYMHRYGLPDESCQIYQAKSTQYCDAAAICHNCMPVGEDIFPYKCWAVEDPAKVYVKEYGIVSGEAGIMSEIIERGPVTCGFASIDDFDYNYRGGVYIDTTNATDVNHDVEIVGWGVDHDGTKYWKARNSWGTYWGENGFFRIARGINNMLIEEECTFAIVDVREHKKFIAGKFGGSMYGIVPPGEKTNTPVGVPPDGESIMPVTYPPVTPAPGSPEDPDSYLDNEDDEGTPVVHPTEAPSKHGKKPPHTHGKLGKHKPTHPASVDNLVLVENPAAPIGTQQTKKGQQMETQYLKNGAGASPVDVTPQAEQGYDMGSKWQDEAKTNGWGGDANGQLNGGVGGPNWVNGGWQRYVNGQYAGGAGGNAAGAGAGAGNGAGAGGNWQQYIPGAAKPAATVTTIDTEPLTAFHEDDISIWQHKGDTWYSAQSTTSNAFKGYTQIATKYADIYVKDITDKKSDVDQEIVVVKKGLGDPVGGGDAGAGDWHQYIPRGAQGGQASSNGGPPDWVQQYIPKGATGGNGANGAPDWQKYIPSGVDINHNQDSSDSDSDSKSYESSKSELSHDSKSPKHSSHSHDVDDDDTSSKKHSHYPSSKSSSSSQRYTEDDSIKPSSSHILTQDDPAIRDAILDILRKHGIHPDQQGQQLAPAQSTPNGEDPTLAIKRAIAEALTKGDAKATQVKDSVKQALKTIQDEWLKEIDRQDQILKSNQTDSIKSGVHDVAHSIDDLIRTEIDEANKMSHTIQQQANKNNKGTPQTNIEIGSMPTSQSSMLNALIILAIVVMGIMIAVYHTRAKNDYMPIQ